MPNIVVIILIIVIIGITVITLIIVSNIINIDINLPQVSNGMHAANQEFSSVEANANDLTIISLTSMTIIKMIKMIITIIIRQMPMRATEWAPSQQR